MLCTTTKYAFYMRKLDEILINTRSLNLSYISICVHSRLDEGGATSGHKGRELVCERSHSSFQRVRTKILTLSVSLSLMISGVWNSKALRARHEHYREHCRCLALVSDSFVELIMYSILFLTLHATVS